MAALFFQLFEVDMPEAQKNRGKSSDTVRICLQKLPDGRYATPGLSLGTTQESRKVMTRDGPTTSVRNTYHRLLPGMYAEVDMDTAEVLIKRGLCVEYNPRFHGELRPVPGKAGEAHLIGPRGGSAETELLE